jgi:hypothetical protein
LDLKHLSVVDDLICLVGEKKYRKAHELAIDLDVIPELNAVLIDHVNNVRLSETEKFMFLAVFPSHKKHLSSSELVISDGTADMLAEAEHRADEGGFDSLIALMDVIRTNNLNNARIMRSLVERTSTFISGITVSSLETEAEASIRLPVLVSRLLVLKLKLIDSSQFEAIFLRLKALRSFVRFAFFARYGQSYTFRDFGLKNSILPLYDVVRTFDHGKLFHSFQAIWGIDKSPASRALNCFHLGLLEDGMSELQTVCNTLRVLKIDIQLMGPELERCLHYPSIDVTDLTEDVAQVVKRIETGYLTYQYLHDKMEGVLQNPVGLHWGSPRIAALTNVLQMVGAIDQLLYYLSRHGLFDEAFDLFEGPLCAQMNKGQLLLSSIIVPAFAFSQWNTFLRRLSKRVNDGIATALLEAFSVMRQRGLWNTLFDLQRKTEFYDDAVVSGINLFHEAISWKIGLNVLNDLRIVLGKSLQEEGRHRFLSFDYLLPLQQRLSLQIGIWQFFAKNIMPFRADLELFGPESHTLALAAHLLLTFQVGFFSELCELPGIVLDQVWETVIDHLQDRGDGQIPLFFQQLVRFGPATYQMITEGLLKCIRSRAVSDEGFINFVKGNVKGDALKVKILSKYGFRQEAIRLARGDPVLLRVIEN